MLDGNHYTAGVDHLLDGWVRYAVAPFVIVVVVVLVSFCF